MVGPAPCEVSSRRGYSRLGGGDRPTQSSRGGYSRAVDCRCGAWGLAPCRPRGRGGCRSRLSGFCARTQGMCRMCVHRPPAPMSRCLYETSALRSVFVQVRVSLVCFVAPPKKTIPPSCLMQFDLPPISHCLSGMVRSGHPGGCTNSSADRPLLAGGWWCVRLLSSPPPIIPLTPLSVISQ